MADDGKRSETVCTKVDERMAVDLLHESAKHDQSVSTFIYLLLRTHLYGTVQRPPSGPQSTSSD